MDGITPTPPLPADTAPGAARRPLLSRRLWLGYAAFLALLILLFVALTLALPRLIDRYQYNRPRYAAERAIRDLAVKPPDLAAARREVATALADDRPYAMRNIFGQPEDESWEGRVLRDRVLIDQQLAAELFNAGALDDAEAILWKSLLESHLASRPVEFIAPWELMYALEAGRGPKGGAPAWQAAVTAARILGALGAENARPPDQIRPIAYKVDPTTYVEGLNRMSQSMIAAFRLASAAEAPSEYREAAPRLAASALLAGNPVVRLAIEALQHRVLVRADNRLQAADVYRQAWGKDPPNLFGYWASGAGLDPASLDPNALDWVWDERPADARPTLDQFMDRLSVDPRISAHSFAALQPVRDGYFNPEARFEPQPGGAVRFASTCSGALDVETTAPVHRIYLAYEAKPALGFYPIVLLRADKQPYIPFYCDAPTPEMAGADLELTPGRHHLEFTFLNAAGFDTRHAFVASMREKAIVERREVRLIRFALIQ